MSGPGAPFIFSWAPPPSDVALRPCGPTTTTPTVGANGVTTYTASATCGPVAATTTYTLTVTNVCNTPVGGFTAQATAKAVAAPKQAIQAIAPKTVVSGE